MGIEPTCNPGLSIRGVLRFWLSLWMDRLSVAADAAASDSCDESYSTHLACQSTCLWTRMARSCRTRTLISPQKIDATALSLNSIGIYRLFLFLFFSTSIGATSSLRVGNVMRFFICPFLFPVSSFRCFVSSCLLSDFCCSTFFFFSLFSFWDFCFSSFLLLLLST